MAKFKPYLKDQLMLFPKSINDYVPEAHLTRLINKVIEHLDTRAIENKYSDLGQNTYHPKILIKLLFYGYAVGERSGRVIERRCETDTSYIYLAQMYKPDFRTINDFRKNHLVELSGYFVDIVRMCKELGLASIGQINIDGTKIKANAASRRTKTKEEYNDWAKRIDEKIKQILKDAEETDAKEDELYGDKRGDELPEAINTEEKLKKKIEEISKTLKDEKERKNITDPDARFMRSSNHRIEANYNCQIAVTKEQIIVSGEVTTNSSDGNALIPMVKSSDENLRAEVKEIAADSGYGNYDNYEYLVKNNKTGYIPDQNYRKDMTDEHDAYHHDNFQYDKENNKYICPEGKALELYRVHRKYKEHGQSLCKVYECGECAQCLKRSACSPKQQRTIYREDRKELQEQMRARLQSDIGRKKYNQRMWTTEPVFGHMKHNLGYRQFLLRTFEKVRGEFRLMCIGYNLKKMHKMLAFS